jgi:hypothetical protein
MTLATGLFGAEENDVDVSARSLVVGEDEQGQLKCLGAAVVALWSKLPGDISASLLEQAVLMTDSQLTKEQFEAFLAEHAEPA